MIAGDDEPYYRHKRVKFLKLLSSVDMAGKNVLEVGPGPGGNLFELLSSGAKSLTGCDISDEMLEIARHNLPESVRLAKTNGTQLPFGDATFDTVFSATVLQHNTNDAMMRSLLAEMCRVSSGEVVIFEQVDLSIRGSELRLARPIQYYASVAEESGYSLVESRMIRIIASYYVSGAIRKIFNPSTRVEGQPSTWLANILQSITLPITKLIDPYIGIERDLAMMRFTKSSK